MSDSLPVDPDHAWNLAVLITKLPEDRQEFVSAFIDALLERRGCPKPATEEDLFREILDDMRESGRWQETIDIVWEYIQRQAAEREEVQQAAVD